MARAATTKPETEPPEQTDDGTGAGGEDTEESRIRAIVADELAKLNPAGGDDTDGGDAGTSKPRTQTAIEDDVEAKVRAAIGKLRTEEERDSRLSALEEKVKEPERPPVKTRISTRLMGWKS